jgi:hypothetical protein
VTQAAVSPRTEIINRVLEYPIPDTVIEKYIDKYGVTEQVARSHERELKRYLAMCLADPEAAYGMFGPVDEFWHTWILFTREWCEFSQAVAGRYIHHRPTTRQEKRAAAASREPSAYQRFLADYPGYFGEEAPAASWPGAQPIQTCANCHNCGSCAGCAGGCGQSCSGCFSSPGRPWDSSRER